jgi:hypothetical protein
MDRNNKYVLVGIILLILLGLIIFLFLMRAPQQGSASSLSSAAKAPDAASAVRSQVPAIVASKMKIVEKRVLKGNEGYIVRDGKYVYFGTCTIIREEVAEE